MPKSNLESFYNEILTDRVLQDELRSIDSVDSLIKLVIKKGQEKGYDLTTHEVQSYINESQSEPDIDVELSDELLEAVAGGGWRCGCQYEK